VTKREKYLERIHILRTLINYGPTYGANLAERCNTECDHDAFDDLAEIKPRGITQKLNALSLEGMARGWWPGDGQPMLWEVTEKGRAASAIFEAQEDRGG
jgi:hypothetical protein